MTNRTIVLTAALSLGVVGAAGVGYAAVGADGDDTETPITGDALQRASAAALAYTDGGSVTETEVGDEESYYEVEVTHDDGSQVDVQLDEQFRVVDSSSDDESEHEQNDD